MIGTRGSSLALCQAEIVRTKLEERYPDRRVELRTIKAQADKNPELSLVAIGGEGVFVKELETALQERRITLAVHSMKDVPLDIPEDLRIAAVLEREEPRDALVSRSGAPLDELPAGATVGTSSLRRRSQLLRRRKDLALREIRGNVDTRLRKLGEGQFDAIVLAACGLIRLGLEDRITQLLAFEEMLPEPGQGALALEARGDDPDTLELLSGLEDSVSRACVDAERAFLKALGGGCRVPIAAYASAEHGTLSLEGTVVRADGSAEVRGRLSGSLMEPMALGERLASELESRGARKLLGE